MKAWVTAATGTWLLAASLTAGCSTSSSSKTRTVECSEGEISACLGEEDCRGEQVCGEDRTWRDCVCDGDGSGGNGGETSNAASTGGSSTSASSSASGGNETSGNGGTTSVSSGGTSGATSTGGSGGTGTGGTTSSGGAGGSSGSGGAGGTGGTTLDACPTDLSGPNLVLIPAGRTDIGALSTSSDLDDTEPITTVDMDAFCLDETEVTVADYVECRDASDTPCTVPQVVEPENPPFPTTYYDCNFDSTPADAETLPINCVSWAQASAYCEWAGKRLPTEFEWEYAARGEAARVYPWGNDDPPDPSDTDATLLANWNTNGPVAVGSYPDGATPEGVLDMTGNLWEWVRDEYCDSYDPDTRVCLSTHVSRGGGWSTQAIRYLRAWARDSDADGDARYGFRCAYSP